MELSRQQSGSALKVDYCEYVVEEILVTERQYMQDLEDIILVSY